MTFAAALKWLGRSSLWTSRALAWSVLGVALACAAVILSLRYWFLPNIENYREDIAAAVSRAANQRITIERIAGNWDGMWPQLKLEGVSVYDKSGRRALELERVDGTLAWRSLVKLRPQFLSLDIYRPALAVRRDGKGVVSVAGIELEGTGDGFTEWLLEQPDVEILDAAVSWTDELRGAPELKLAGVNFRLVNRGGRHRFGLRAVPPEALAAPLNVRGDLRGDGAAIFARLHGRLFLQVDHVDLAAWQQWVDIPVELTRGAGALRTWLTFNRNELTDVIADLRLAGVKSRLRDDLPQLDLDELAGRLAWKSRAERFEFSATQLRLASGEAVLPNADITLRVARDRKGVSTGELQASALKLAPLVVLADRLPLEKTLRAELVALSPRGAVTDVHLKWKGEWPSPETYSARGRFEGLAFNRRGSLPGMSGLSGVLDGSEKGGTLQLTAQRASFDMAGLFAEPLALDTGSAILSWTRSAERFELKLTNVAFANPDIAGTLSGTWRGAPQSRGEVDLTGTLARGDVRSLGRYLPATLDKDTRKGLETSFLAGKVSDARLRVKGRVEDFPYADEKRGLFHVQGKVSGGLLYYAHQWPRIEQIEGDLQFRGQRMEFAAPRGMISGVRLGKVQAEIRDLTAQNPLLTVNGEAEGPSADFLAFIETSPVSNMIERFTEGMKAQGPGRLALKLALPLGALSGTKVAGTYQLLNNHVVLERDLPPLEQANGRIEFTESSVRTTGLNGVFLGGPVTISAATQGDGTLRANLQGRVNADNVRKAGGPALMQHLRGATDWRGTLTMRRKVPELVIESNLQGIGSSLPAPFAKAPGDAVAMRIERRFVSPQQDRVSLAYGEVVKAEFARRVGEKGTVIERGTVRLGGGEAGEPDRPGVWVRGSLKRIDFDEWLAFTRGDGDAADLTIAGAEVKLGEVNFFGRRFNDLALTVSPRAGATQIVLAGKEIDGTATWRGDDKGRLTARLKRLAWPVAESKVPVQAPRLAAQKVLDLPALDIAVEDFQFGAKQLGRLELNAVHRNRDWRIERLRVANADSVLTADGVWQGWLSEPRTQLNVQLEVSDIGAALTRFGYPQSVRRGTAKIEGNLAWTGGPQDFDYPTLGGQLVVEAAKGQFVKLEPGLGKLLGLLSLQALPRRITLDFRDVFSDGFAFDSISGTAKIERGIATTDNFRTQGPSARVLMTGEVDLARETQKLRVRVTPALSDSVSIAGAILGGPIAGVAAYVAQKLLRDPLEQLVSYEYHVTGSWSDPQVARPPDRGPAPQPESGP